MQQARVCWSEAKLVALRKATRTVPGESALITAIRQQAVASCAGASALRVGIGDDCAVLRPGRGCEICITTDFTLEGRHFVRARHPPESVGHRCLTRGLSDLAAMGAKPLAVFLSLAIPAQLPAAWVEGFLRGFLALARKHRVSLAGGDTAESPVIAKSRTGPIAADIVAVGEVPRGKAVLRSGARPGDRIYVTGMLGGAAAELAALRRSASRFRILHRASAENPHLFPQPRVDVGQRLRSIVHAMIDISDGLSTDLTHLCEESRVSALIDEKALPVHPLAAGSGDPLRLALHGGDDYELLFTASPSLRIPSRIAGVSIHCIGAIRRSARGRPPVVLVARDGRQVPVTARGWEHFR